jgi:hypothetical protein
MPLRPLNPALHAAYAGLPDKPRLPSDVRHRLRDLCAARSADAEDALDQIDREIVRLAAWYVLRPDDIARATIAHHSLPRRVLSIDQATLVLAAIGEAGYPIAGNGAPDYEREHWDDPDPVRGEERDRVIWAAARHWATMASTHLTYVSLGDCRGWLPRPVQYDQPGGMHPSQRAALTFGPWADRGDPCNSHAYMRRHTRRLILVRAGGAS